MSTQAQMEVERREGQRINWGLVDWAIATADAHDRWLDSHPKEARNLAANAEWLQWVPFHKGLWRLEDVA